MTPEQRRREPRAELNRFRATYRSAKKANRAAGIKATRSARRAVMKELREVNQERAS